ncbi:MAG: alpha,2-mannosyltransferase [Frankiaceae bacterium]|jgi:alpha-1,2-mannosyltransferase|nr:alpha,2-mannosyltransferase [Frankiaceae bacterium]
MHRRLPAAAVAGLAVFAALVGWLVVARLTATPPQRLVDLDVYRNAGTSVLHGRDLYGFLSHPPQRLPFTYPPFAALLAVPLSWLPFTAAGILWTLGELACTVALTAIGFRALRPRAGRWWPLLLGLLAGLVQLTLPFRDEVKFGQVDELLALLVAVDCLRDRRRTGGVLVGVATAVKLTPAVFVVYLLVRGRRRAAATAAATFAACTLLAAAVLPGDSDRYWTDVLFHTERLRSNAGTANQSLRGMWLRALPGHDHGVTAAWLACAAAVAAVGLWRARAMSRRGDELAAVALVGLVAVLVSPVSWIHHLVWLPLVLGVLVGAGRDLRRVVLAITVWVFFVLSVPWLGSHAAASRSFVPLGRIVQDGFGLMAVVLVLWLPTSVARPVTLRHNESVHLGGDQ